MGSLAQMPSRSKKHGRKTQVANITGTIAGKKMDKTKCYRKEATGPGVLVIFQRNFRQSDGARQIRKQRPVEGEKRVELQEDKVGLVYL